MLDKIDLITRLKKTLQTKNIALSALNFLPKETQKNLEDLLKRALIFYNRNLIKADLEVISHREVLLKNIPEDLKLKKGELVIIILPEQDKKYVFQTLVEEIFPQGYKVKILDPRYEKRIKIREEVPVFLSFISPRLLFNLLNLNKDYYLLRESNMVFDEEHEEKEYYFFDLIFDERNMLDQEFKSVIRKTHINGTLIDISSNGMCVKTEGIIHSPEDLTLIYARFEFESKGKLLKFGLLGHLRNFRHEQGFTYIHLSFLMGFKPDVWEKIKPFFKELI